MKKIIMFLLVFYFTTMPIRAYADGASVEVNIEGRVKKGQSVDILVNVKNVERFYAASVDFIYDTELLKVDSIQATDFITKHSSDIMELGGEVDKNGNTATYSFTFLGDKPGVSGSGNLVVIKATVLSDGKLTVSEDNMKVKLVQRSGDTVDNYPFTFVGHSIDDNNTGVIPKPEDENEQGNSNETNSTDNNTDKEISDNSTDQSNNSVSENNDEITHKQQDTNKIEDSGNNEANSVTEKNEDKDISNTNKEANNSNKVTVQDSKDKSDGAGYVVIGFLALVGLSFGGYKLYKSKGKEKSE